MLQLIAVCYLTGQMLFTAPEGWRMTEAYTGGSREFSQQITLLYCPPDCEEARRKAFVKLERTIAVGETVEAPQGCKLTIEAKKGS